MLAGAIETGQPLKGRRILVVEDEFLVAAQLVETLEREGVDVVGAVGSVRKALALIGSAAELDAAVVDINLRGQVAYPIVDALTEQGRPFVFATVCQPEEIPLKYRDALRCGKPVQSPVLLRQLQWALAQQDSSFATEAAYPRASKNSAPEAREDDLVDWINAIAIYGDIEAYSSIFMVVAPKIKRYMLDHGATNKIAEELSQDALLRIWREASEFGSSDTAKTWFFTIARDLGMDLLK